MEGEPIIGISYEVDDETKKLLGVLKFSQTELNNLYELVKDFGEHLSILKITELQGIFTSWELTYRCSIIAVDRNNKKIFYDMKNVKSYTLNLKEEVTSLDIMSKYYLIIFTNKIMIA